MRFMFRKRSLVILVISALQGTSPGLGSDPESAALADPEQPISVLLLTLDTTRSDSLGSYGGAAVTPNLDRLAGDGARFERAVTPSPLTFPAHATLLTGLDPPQHGVRDNGTGVLPADIPTLATVLDKHGYSTGAFVASRVLDRRFGLGRGFQVYDDRMLAERIGEYGYPERDAAAVTDAAVKWLDTVGDQRPVFLWVHYYDPHAPYQPPPELRGSDPRSSYLGEVAYMDRQLGRLVSAVRAARKRLIVVAVGDHGEALGEHGERTHGVFLYRATVEVPLIISGTGVPRGEVVQRPVGIRRLPSTVLRLLDIEGLEDVGPVLPGLLSEDTETVFPPIYSEAMMPATAYGWSPLRSVTDGRWRYVEAPRPELYDLAAEPEEVTNLIEKRSEAVARLRSILDAFGRRPVRSAAALELDAETEAALRSLGYVSGASAAGGDGIDPKRGIALLARFENAKAELARGEVDEAVASLQELVQRNPSNVPFRVRLGEAQLAAGMSEQGLASYRDALARNPRSEFLRLKMAHALRELGRREEARAGYREVLEIDGRSASAWLWLAGLEEDPKRERDVLRQAVETGADSVTILLRLARLERNRDQLEEAEGLLAKAAELAPGSVAVWLERSRVALARSLTDEAMSWCQRAEELAPTDPASALCIARVHIARGDADRARPHLRRAAVLGRGTDAEAEAMSLLESLDTDRRDAPTRGAS
jgi:arylsulfatase A-like enzyme/thioredoxin-like negative regulator of GroEL